MSASGTAGALSPIPNAKPFKAGYDPRRQVGPKLSPAEIEFKAALEKEHIPKASAALAKLYEAGMAALQTGDVLAGTKALETFFKICGLIQKPTDNAVIHETAKALIGEMIAEARARRTEP